MVDIHSSIDMIRLTHDVCDLYKVGLMSGRRYNKTELRASVEMIIEMYSDNKFYFKDSLLKQAGISREDLPENCVDRNYSLFDNQNEL